MRKKLQKAYEQLSYTVAKSALLSIKKELEVLNTSAVKSLEEGFEETLTLHKLGLFSVLGTSFKTTNCIESFKKNYKFIWEELVIGKIVHKGKGGLRLQL